MNSIKEPVKNQIIINKSIFITNIYHVENVESINEILTKTKKEYYDATHNCYAYILGDNAETQKCSDDGEPQRTAGFPMLNVLKQQDLTNCLAIVTRYFGGVLLGAGGLTRAYSSSVSEALKKAVFCSKKILSEYKLFLTYPLYNALINDLKKFDITNQIFADLVMLVVGIPQEFEKETIDLITEKSNGKAIFSLLGTYEILV